MALNNLKKVTVPFYHQLQKRIGGIKLPEKWKGGRLQRWAEFWTSMFEDYKAVGRDVIEESRTKPRKVGSIVAGLGIMIYALETNPDERSFRDQLVSCSNELLLLSENIRNQDSSSYVQFLVSCYNEGILRRFNVGLFSVMWLDNYHPDCKQYSAQCSYLRPKYLTFYERIIDVGVFKNWVNLNRRMINFDINPVEWRG